jgi:hypothetical protein
MPLTSTEAATKSNKPMKALLASPISVGHLTSDMGDQISSAVLTPTGLVITGSIVSTSSDGWVTSQTLGGTDGFIAKVDFTGNHLWDTRLGSPLDDVSTAVLRDKKGDFWVAGVSASNIPTPTPTPTPLSTPPLNPDSVTVSPVVIPSQALTVLKLWHLNSQGQIVQIYSKDLGATVFPQSILQSGNSFTILGQIAPNRDLTINLDPMTGFGDPSFHSHLEVKKQAVTLFAGGANKYQIFVAHGKIKALPSWRSTVPHPILLQFSKAGALKAAHFFQGQAIFAGYARGQGVVVLTEIKEGYGLCIVTPSL